jgi:hypothetical protein
MNGMILMNMMKMPNNMKMTTIKSSMNNLEMNQNKDNSSNNKNRVIRELSKIQVSNSNSNRNNISNHKSNKNSINNILKSNKNKITMKKRRNMINKTIIISKIKLN